MEEIALLNGRSMAEIQRLAFEVFLRSDDSKAITHASDAIEILEMEPCEN
jgi:hypothetical protein